MSEKDNDFLEQLFHKYADYLFRIAYARLKNREAAEDMVQDTFETAHKNITKVRESENPIGWLCETLKNKILHERRSRARFLLLQTKVQIDGDIESSQLLASIEEDGFDGVLTRDEYFLLKMTILDGFTLSEAAEELGITYDTARKRSQRVRDKLEQYFKQ